MWKVCLLSLWHFTQVSFLEASKVFGVIFFVEIFCIYKRCSCFVHPNSVFFTRGLFLSYLFHLNRAGGKLWREIIRASSSDVSVCRAERELSGRGAHTVDEHCPWPFACVHIIHRPGGTRLYSLVLAWGNFVRMVVTSEAVVLKMWSSDPGGPQDFFRVCEVKINFIIITKVLPAFSLSLMSEWWSFPETAWHVMMSLLWRLIEYVPEVCQF